MGENNLKKAMFKNQQEKNDNVYIYNIISYNLNIIMIS